MLCPIKINLYFFLYDKIFIVFVDYRIYLLFIEFNLIFNYTNIK